MNTEVKKKSMTQEQKELLFKDLCARLPYGIKAEIKYYDGVYKLQAIYTDGTTYVTRDVGNPIETYFEDCKPYLFPMSSITDEQEKELNKVYSDEADLIAEHLKSDISGNVHTHRFNHQLSLNWYLKNHFDIHDLIPMGLAIDATGLNIY